QLQQSKLTSLQDIRVARLEKIPFRVVLPYLSLERVSAPVLLPDGDDKGGKGEQPVAQHVECRPPDDHLVAGVDVDGAGPEEVVRSGQIAGGERAAVETNVALLAGDALPFGVDRAKHAVLQQLGGKLSLRGPEGPFAGAQ